MSSSTLTRWALIEGAAARELLGPAEFVREIALAHAVAAEEDELGDEERPMPLARATTADRREEHGVPATRPTRSAAHASK